MSLYDKSSLVMIPSGKKDGTVFSQKPVDGSGDFTFSRGSNLAATRVGPTGLIEKGRENLLKYSNQFDTGWNKQNIVVSTNSVQNPFNTGTTFTMTEQVGTTQYRIYSTTLHSTTSGTMYTHSVYVKRLSGTRDFAIIDVSGGARVYFNMTTISVGSEAVGKGKIEDVGNGWYRLSVYGVATGSSALYLAMTNGTATGSETYTSDGSGSFALYAAQLEIGLAATDYIETGATTGKAGLLEDEPRFDYSGGATCPSLLLEPSRTQLLPYTEWIGGWSDVNDATIDGPQSFTLGSTGARIQAGSIGGPSGDFVFYAVFDSADIGKTIKLSYFDSTAGSWNFGSDITIDSNGRAERLISTGSNVIGNVAFYGTSTSQSFTLKYCQFEAGSYPTSYIPNHSGGSVTRGADDINTSNVSALFSETGGTLFIDFQKDYALDGGFTGFFRMHLTGPSTNNIYYGFDSDKINFVIQRDGVIQAAGTSSSTYIGTRVKTALVYSENDFRLYVNGSLLATDTSGLTPTGINKYAFGVNSSIPVNAKGSIKQQLFFSEALSDADCIALTTL